MGASKQGEQGVDMMDAKALLDSLMGPSRDKAKKDQKKDEWKEEKVCKRYLVGFCPTNVDYNLFLNTKYERQFPVCTKLHAEALKFDFERHPDGKTYQADWEGELIRFVDTMLSEAAKRADRERPLCRSGGGDPVVRLTEGQRLGYQRMQSEREEAFAKAEQLAEKGNISESQW